MREPISQSSFADLELQRQGVMEPALQQVSEYLDRHPELTKSVEDQLQKGLKKSQTGRRGLTGAQVLRSWLLMRFKNWDYRELAERIRDGITLRLFTRFYSNPVPCHTAFNRTHNRLTPELIERLNEDLLKAAVEEKLEDGAALRGDTTVVETDIHHPTDASLLWDIVRVVSRNLQQLRKLAPHTLPRYPKRTRAAKRRMQELQRMTASQREHLQVPKYRELIGITEQTLKNARHAVETLSPSRAQSFDQELSIGGSCQQLIEYCRIGDRVVDQARRRVLYNEQVPTAEKIYSIFEPHTALIKRGKAGKPVEFGHKIYLAETRSGLIAHYWVLDGNPSDEDHVAPSIQRHKATFGRSPELYANDRGAYSPENIKACQDEGVGCVCIPQRGGQKTDERKKFEKSPAFKQGQRFRAGIEGRISVLMRGRGMKRCLKIGKRGLELLVGVAVLANNLLRIAALLLDKAQKTRKKFRPQPALLPNPVIYYRHARRSLSRRCRSPTFFLPQCPFLCPVRGSNGKLPTWTPLEPFPRAGFRSFRTETS